MIEIYEIYKINNILNNIENFIDIKKNKKVKFNNIKNIYLIPYYSEITKSLDDIWWNNNDILNAIKDSMQKIKIY